ncbi:MAG TPA: succinate dehydrogenase iron-sulfur subunit [archaeon]|nr:succinate dehydrogenase iron-sulfur subunit [archaeon]
MLATESKDNISQKGQEVQIKILRFDPDKDKTPYFQSYRLKHERGMTVLDALMLIKETQDPTLSYRKSCRMGICGSCAMQVNGKPVLTCQTQIKELNSDRIVVRPLPNYPILRDVVPDLRNLFNQHQNIKPHIIRTDMEEVNNPSGEFVQTPEELEKYLQFSYCVKCGACLAACPTCATDESFTGPQALMTAYRYVSDSRDAGLENRLEALDIRDGVWRCHFAGACSEACPKGVDPALGIQLLKKEVFKLRVLGLKKEPAPLALKPANVGHRKDIPKAPERNVEK